MWERYGIIVTHTIRRHPKYTKPQLKCKAFIKSLFLRKIQVGQSIKDKANWKTKIKLEEKLIQRVENKEALGQIDMSMIILVQTRTITMYEDWFGYE